MAEFLTTMGTSSRIEEIMMNARQELYLVSPFLQISKTFYERLKDASESGVKIKIVFGKDELKSNERNSLAEIKNLELFFFENLHAKCYFNEGKMVITSMNMYEFSEKNNREMGVFIDSGTDSKLYENAKRETLSIIKSSEIVTLKKPERYTKREDYKSNPANSQAKNNQNNAFCIRCGHRIPLHPGHPYCNDCYSVWVQFENPFYEEMMCHMCGKPEGTTIQQPLCYSCYKEYQNKYTI
ncbi:MAG: phospholipase D family protein [Bacteroidales bacterium]